MQTSAEYLAATESAVRHLFAGIAGYDNLLRSAVIPVPAMDESIGTAAGKAAYEAWEKRNAERVAAAWHAEKMFLAERFAMDTLCGAVLQAADKALDLYGKDGSIPPDWNDVVTKKTEKKLAKYFCGRLIRAVPLGLVIYAARNQHVHFGEPKTPKVRVKVFELLATAHGYPTPVADPMFTLSNRSLMSFASNVTGLIKWRTYEQYENDMHALLEV